MDSSTLRADLERLAKTNPQIKQQLLIAKKIIPSLPEREEIDRYCIQMQQIYNGDYHA